MPAEYEAARLKLWAQRVLGGIPLDYYRDQQRKRRSQRLPELWLSDAERLELATYLTRLAGADRVLAAAVNIGKKRGRRPSRDKAGRACSIALDYRLTKKRVAKSDVAVIEVGNAWYGQGAVTLSRNGWSSAGKRVLETYQTCREQRAWREWAKLYVGTFARRFRREHPKMTSGARLEALSKSLRQSG